MENDDGPGIIDHQWRSLLCNCEWYNFFIYWSRISSSFLWMSEKMRNAGSMMLRLLGHVQRILSSRALDPSGYTEYFFPGLCGSWSIKQTWFTAILAVQTSALQPPKICAQVPVIPSSLIRYRSMSQLFHQVREWRNVQSVSISSAEPEWNGLNHSYFTSPCPSGAVLPPQFGCLGPAVPCSSTELHQLRSCSKH